MDTSLRFTQILERDAEPDRPAIPPDPPGPRRLLWWIAGGILLAAGVPFSAALLLRPSATACIPAAHTSVLQHLGPLEARGQFSTVMELASRLLDGRRGNLCADARQLAAASWYQAASFQLLTKPRPEVGVVVSPLAMHQTARAWQTLSDQADQYHVPEPLRLPDRSISILAGNAGQFELSVSAFQSAWASGDIDSSDLQDVARYEQMLTVWGSILAAPSFPATRQQGATTLATANSIAAAYGLADDRACRALKHLGYSDCTRVPPDSTDPILKAVAHPGAR